MRQRERSKAFLKKALSRWFRNVAIFISLRVLLTNRDNDPSHPDEFSLLALPE